MADKKKKSKFLRKDWHKKPKLGKGRRKKQKWVRPRGRHNKMREKRKGHAKTPRIGFSQAKEVRGKIKGLIPVIVNNIGDLQKVNKENNIAIFASVGMKNKIGMVRKAKELGVRTNFDLNKFLENAENQIKERKEKKAMKKKAKKEHAKKVKEEKKTEKIKEQQEGEKEEKAKEKEKKLLMKPVEKEMPRVAAQKDVMIKRKTLEK